MKLLPWNLGFTILKLTIWRMDSELFDGYCVESMTTAGTTYS